MKLEKLEQIIREEKEVKEMKAVTYEFLTEVIEREHNALCDKIEKELDMEISREERARGVENCCNFINTDDADTRKEAEKLYKDWVWDAYSDIKQSYAQELEEAQEEA